MLSLNHILRTHAQFVLIMPFSLWYKSTFPQLNFGRWKAKDNIITKMFLQSGWHKNKQKEWETFGGFKSISESLFFYFLCFLPACSLHVYVCVVFQVILFCRFFPGFISCHCSSLCIFSRCAFSCCLSVHAFVDLLFLSSLGLCSFSLLLIFPVLCWVSELLVVNLLPPLYQIPLLLLSTLPFLGLAVGFA